MSGFSYPTPFEFENRGREKDESSTRSSSAPKEKRAAGRAKSNDENLFSAGKSIATPQRSMGPKTKSGRCLPKPAPSLPIRGMNSNGSGKHSNGKHTTVRGRSPPAHRRVGQSQSSNLETMQSASRIRSSSTPKKSQPKEREPEDHVESDRRPSSLKNFLTSPVKNNSSKRMSKGGDLQVSLHSASDADDKTSDRQKPGALKQFLTSPLRRTAPTKPRSVDMNFMGIDTLDLEPDDRTESKTRSKASSRKKRNDNPNEEPSSSKKDKPKSFKQLLGKKQPPAKSRSGELELMGEDRGSRGRGSFEVQPSSVRKPASPERETSLSPEPQKPGSLLTNLLDTLYDSYVDPKAEEEQAEDFNNLNSSVSRFDMSLSSLF